MNQTAHQSLDDRNFWQSLDAFLFEPRSAHTLALIRIATGGMIAYIHLVWMLHLDAFMGPYALFDNTTWRSLHQNRVPDYKWTYLALTDSMLVVWAHELLAFVAGIAMAIGIKTRVACVLAWFLTLMTVHRMTGFLFGLDQVVMMLSMYLCVSRCGDAWSFDSKREVRDRVERKSEETPSASWSNTFATRLIQFHLCVIYLFGGIGKMRGEMWWDGSAMWYSAAAYEYQSFSLLWIGTMPIVASIVTHITVFWELSYCATIWPRWLRPWTLGIAVFVHGGIALFLGMITFGTMMLVANLAFVEPTMVTKVIASIQRLKPRSTSQ
jgi:uncharacterized membrane protein YphA (DoxX/SURF4 family)